MSGVASAAAFTRAFLITAVAVSLLMLQALLAPLALGNFDIATRAGQVPSGSWRMLGIYIVVIGVMGAWAFDGKRTFRELEVGKRLIYASTIAARVGRCSCEKNAPFCVNSKADNSA